MNFVEKILKRYKLEKILFESVILLIGYPIYALSHLIPRNKNKWVIGNKDVFSDNGKYFYIYLLENTNINVFWITSSKQTEKVLKKKGLPVYYKYSLRGLYHLLTAYVYICTVTTNYINYWTSGGARKVNLWHGVGIKALNKNAAWLKDNSLISRILTPYSYETYDLFLSTSELMNSHFSKSFSLNKKKIFEGIYPRCVFLRNNKEQQMNAIRKYESSNIRELIESLRRYNRIYIYMPTWRLVYGKYFLNYALKDMDELNHVLSKQNDLLLLKLHPAMQYDKYKYESLKNILYVDSSIDIYPILPFTDILITDYSSIYYDYILMEGKGCILYDFDYETYTKEEFEFILDYKKYTPGTHVDTFNELVTFINSNQKSNVNERDWILKSFWGDYENNNLKKLYNHILKIGYEN